jgi:hypothetical protein
VSGRSCSNREQGVYRSIVQLTFVPALDRSVLGRKLTDRIANETASSIVVPQGRVLPIY